MHGDARQALQVDFHGAASLEHLEDARKPRDEALVEGRAARRGGEVAEGLRQLAHHLHDRRLLAGEVAGVEVVGESVEPGEHPRPAVELLVGEAVADPRVLVLALEHLVDGEQPRDRFAVQHLLTPYQRLAALVGIHARGDMEALAAHVVHERVLEAHVALTGRRLVLAHEETALAFGRRDDHGKAQIHVAAQDLLDAEYLPEVVVSGDDLRQLTAQELHLQGVSEGLGVGRQPLRQLEELVRLGYVHMTSLPPVRRDAGHHLFTRRCTAVPVARSRRARSGPPRHRT